MSLKDRIQGVANAQQPWPTFSDSQVSFLERLYPARCIGRSESAEDHLRHAGMVELIERMRGTVIGGKSNLDLTADEEEALDEHSVQIAEGQQAGEGDT